MADNFIKRIAPLDWLRGLMAISVMLYHLVLLNLGQPDASSVIGRLGIYAVSVFFVISGLTNAVICERSLNGFPSVIQFYIKRIFRIWPLLWVAVFISIYLWNLPWDWHNIFLNLTTLFSIGDPRLAIPIGAWSIGNEMIYYAFTPVFIWLFRKNTNGGYLLFLAAFAVAAYFSFCVLDPNQSFAQQFFSPWCSPLNNLFYYLAGIALYYGSRYLTINKWLNVCLLGLFISMFIFIPAAGDLIHVMYGANRILFSLCSIGVVFCFYHLGFNPPSMIRSVLSLFGMATYSVYLLHPIVHKFSSDVLNSAGIHDTTIHIAVAICLTGIVSVLSYRYFELFFITLGKKVAEGRTIIKLPGFKWSMICSILGLGVIVYSNTFHASFQMDDIPSVIDNLNIRNLWDLHQIWSFWPCRFFTYFSLAINYHFSQLDVLGYHVFNLMVHVGTALLVYWFVLLTLATPVMKGQRITSYANFIALFAGLVFVSHPAQTEAVTYIVQRATSLASFFYLASLCFYAKARLLQEGKSNHQRRYYILAVITAVMAMFTKEMTITLPLMIWLYEASFFKANKDLKWKNIAPFLVTLIIIPLTMAVTKYVDFQHLRRVGEQPQDIDSLHYLLTQFRVIVTYLRLLVLPINQNLDYYYLPSKSIFELSTFGSFLLLAGILYAAKRLFKEYRLLSFSIFFFFLSLLPESSFLPIKDVIFEHRLYLPIVGYSIFLVSGLCYLFGKRSLTAMGIILALIIGINSVLTYERNKVWQDMLHLWDDTAHKSPLKPRPWNNAGLGNDHLGNYAKALEYYQKAIDLDPHYPDPYYNQGVVYGKLGNLTQALKAYNKAIELNPYYADAYNNRGVIYGKLGNLTQAALEYTNAINSNLNSSPEKMIFYKNRADVFSKQGRLIEAVEDYHKAIKLDPRDVNVYNNLGTIYDAQGNFAQAVLNYTKAMALNPYIAQLYLNRGNAYNREGNLTGAVEDYNKAITLKPDYADAYDDLAITYYQLKQYDKARINLDKLEKLRLLYDPRRISSLEKLLAGRK